MKSGMIIGMAVGTVLGAYLATKNSKTRQIVDNTEDMIRSKVNEMQSNNSSCCQDVQCQCPEQQG